MKNNKMMIGVATIAAAWLCGCEPNSTIYVSTDGNDGDQGSAAKPFKSFERAREVARTLQHPVTVVIRRGRYERTEPLTLDARDSDVVWTAAPGADVIISGGVAGGEGKPITDAKLLARLPEQARGRVKVWDLKELGFSDVGDRTRNYEHSIQQRAAYYYNQGEAVLDSFGPNNYDECKGKSKGIVEMFEGDEPMAITKSTERVVIDKALGKTRLPHRNPKVMRMKEGIFTYKGDLPSGWMDEPDPWAIGYWSCDWGEQIQRITSITPTSRLMTVSQPYHAWGYRDNQWFSGYNLLCDLKKPGQTVVDGKKRLFYAWTSGGEVRFSNASRLFEITGATNVTIHGMTLTESRGSAVSISNSVKVVVAGCTIKNVGSYGVMVQDGFESGVKDSELYNLGAGGVFLYDSNRKTLIPSRHFVENCHIHHFGRRNRMYRPAIWLVGVGQRAQHNTIHDAPHAAILFFGNDFDISWNEIYRACYASNDCGVLYTGRSWISRGTVIHHNYFHDIIGLFGGPCNGIYMDDSSAGMTIVDNVFAHMPYAIFIAGTRDVEVHRNVFIDCPGAFRLDARGKNWQKPHIDGRVAEYKATGGNHGIRFEEPPYSTKYPQLKTLMQTDVYAPLGNDISDNIWWEGDHTLIDKVRKSWSKTFGDADENKNWEVGGSARSKKSDAWPYYEKQVHDNKIGIDPKTLGWKGIDPHIGCHLQR